MQFGMIVPMLIYLVFAFVCFLKEPKITGYYKVTGIYGRIYAYFSIAFLCGVPLIIVGLVTGQIPSSQTILWIIMLIVFAAVTFFMYYRVYKKSPDFMKKRCLVDLTVSGFGTAFRVSFFVLRLFIGTWWTVNVPEQYVLQNGQQVYVFFDGRVYNPATGKFGITTDMNTVKWDN